MPLFGDPDDSVPGGSVGMRRLSYRTQQWKYVVNDPMNLFDRPNSPVSETVRRRHYSEQLYDFEADPTETANVLAAHPEVAQALRAKIWEQQRAAPKSTAPVALDDSIRERLKTLGYIAD
jgi:hypothetical protein